MSRRQAELPNTWPEDGMMFEARFARKDCTPCEFRTRCTRAKNEPRLIGLQAREYFEALQAARRHQTTEGFRQSYAARAGIGGTHAQAVTRCGLRSMDHRSSPRSRREICRALMRLILLRSWATPRVS
jgi:Transposase DDE domain